MGWIQYCGANVSSSREQAAVNSCHLTSHTRTSTITGYPSIGCLFNETVDLLTSDADPFGIPRSFKILLLCQKFYNRACLSLSACIEDGRGVPHQLVDHMEREFRTTHQSLLAGEHSDLDNLTLLATLLDLQVYYFLPQADIDPSALQRNCLRAYSTAETVVRTALALQASTGFLSHAPHHVFRTVLTATCVVFKVLRSSYRAFIDGGGDLAAGGATPAGAGATGRGSVDRRGGGGGGGDGVAKDCFLALSHCSARDGDLPARAARLFESYWMLRGWLPVQDVPTTDFAGRMGASMTFACLKLWKDDVERAGTAAAAQGMQAMASSGSTAADNAAALAGAVGAAGVDGGSATATPLVQGEFVPLRCFRETPCPARAAFFSRSQG